MAKKLDPYRQTARMALAPWLVEAALARLPETLGLADQRVVLRATRTPHKSGGLNGGANILESEPAVTLDYVRLSNEARCDRHWSTQAVANLMLIVRT